MGLGQRRRDDDEYVAFVEASQQRLRRTAYLLCGDWSLAADLVQEALVRVYVAWPRLERAGGLPTYARRALVSACADHHRRRWTTERVSAVDPDALVDPGATGTVDDRDLLLRALRTLGPGQRACVVLRHLDGLDVAETAHVLGLSTGTVKSQTARGLEALRRHLGASVEASVTMGETP